MSQALHFLISQTRHFLSQENFETEENWEREIRIAHLKNSMWWAMKNRRSWWPLESEIASFSSLSPIPSTMAMPPPSRPPPRRLPTIPAERFALFWFCFHRFLDWFSSWCALPCLVPKTIEEIWISFFRLN